MLVRKNVIPPGGFEPPSPAPKAGMIDRYTTGVCLFLIIFLFGEMIESVQFPNA